jgi:hypothetical protein
MNNLDKDELVKRAKPFLEKDGKDSIIATTDGQFFYDLSHAHLHKKSLKTRGLDCGIETITKDDIVPKKKKAKNQTPKKEEKTINNN